MSEKSVNVDLEILIDHGKYQIAFDLLGEIFDSQNIEYKLYQIRLYRYMGEFNKALSIIENLKTGDNLINVDTLLEKIYCFWYLGQYLDGKNYLKQAKLLLDVLENEDPENLEYMRVLGKYYQLCYNILFYFEDNETVMTYLFRSIEIRRKNDTQRELAISYNSVGINFWRRNHMEEALLYFEKSLDINFTLRNTTNIMLNLKNLIQAAITLENQDAIENYHQEMQKIYLSSPSNRLIDLYFKFSQALYLKSQKSFREKTRAEDIFLDILNSEVVDNTFIMNSIFNLCELYLFEMKVTENGNLSDKISDLIAILMQIGEKQEINQATIKANFLHARLLLLQEKYEESKLLLMDISNKGAYSGNERIANLISIELDRLLNHELILETLGHDKSINDRLDQINLRETLKMITYTTMDDKDEEPVVFLILNEYGLEIYSKKFKEIANEHLLGSFLTAITMFGNETFGLKTDGYIERIKHNDYTITMRKEDHLLYCYINQGSSRLAVMRIQQFIAILKDFPEIINNTDLFIYATDRLNEIDRHLQEIFVTV